MEYSRTGSKEWSSLRTTTNYTEIKNLQVNTLYTVRVSIFKALSMDALITFHCIVSVLHSQVLAKTVQC